LKKYYIITEETSMDTQKLDQLFQEINDQYTKTEDVEVAGHAFTIEPPDPVQLEKIQADQANQNITSSEMYMRVTALAVTAIDGDPIPSILEQPPSQEGQKPTKVSRYNYLYPYFRKLPKDVSVNIAGAVFMLNRDLENSIGTTVKSELVTRVMKEMEKAEKNRRQSTQAENLPEAESEGPIPGHDEDFVKEHVSRVESERSNIPGANKPLESIPESPQATQAPQAAIVGADHMPIYGLEATTAKRLTEADRASRQPKDS
jgi:hypothetical protein